MTQFLYDRLCCGLCGERVPSGEEAVAWLATHASECPNAGDEDDDDWINPKTGHGADCGCVSCHMSQTQ